MPDFRGEVISIPLDLFRVAAPPLTAWLIDQPSLPCWRLWWNSARGASIRWREGQVRLGPDCFVLVAPETEFDAELSHPISRHLFIHFSLASSRWRLVDRVLAVPCCAATRLSATALGERLSAAPGGVLAEPLLAASLIGAVLAKIDSAVWQPPPGDPRIQRVIGAVEANPSFPWTDVVMARLATLSVGGFARLFRQGMGESPQRYVLRQRLTKARALLLQTKLSLEMITEQCGFCDRSYFTTVFRREIGIPPAQYRNRHQGSM